MSYRDPAQSVEEPLRKIVDGIEEYRRAMRRRLEDGGWTDEHVRDLIELDAKLTFVYGPAVQMATRTW